MDNESELSSRTSPPKSSGPLCKNQRLLNFFTDQKYVDCTFRIDDIEVKAHRLVLACNSPVFEKMLFGEMANDDTINIDDISLMEFNQMLQFMYTEEINITSVMNAWLLFYIADKYLLESLLKICLDYIAMNITMSTLVLSYEYSEMYNVGELKNSCFLDMISCINGIFSCDYHMKPSTLRSILFHTSLDVDYYFLLAGEIIEWGINECTYRQLPVSPINIISILKSANVTEFLYKHWMIIKCDTCEESLDMCQCFSEIAHKTFVLLSDEAQWSEVQEESLSKQNRIIPFNLCKSRRIFKIARRIDLREAEEWVSDISVNRATVILGFLLETEMNLVDCDLFYQGCISVSIHQQLGDSTNKKCCKTTNLKQLLCYNSQQYVALKPSVTLESGRVYEVRVSYKNYTNNNNSSSVICNYMNSALINKTKNSAIQFFEPIGGVIRGVAFYPA